MNDNPSAQASAIDAEGLAPTVLSGRIPGNRGIWVGITCVFVEFTLTSATAGAGARHWIFENGVVIRGGANLALAKP